MGTMPGLGPAALGAVALGLYFCCIRPRQLRWGATEAEVVRSMAGDGVVSQPTFNATRAVTIRAKPDEIWPWLVQMGNTRAGWYSYDWLDNLGRSSAKVVLPQFQTLAIGDLVPMSPDGKQGMYVKDFRTNEFVVWGDRPGDATWTWGLYRQSDSHTRLITRVRLRYRWFSPTILFSLLVEITDIVMMRKSLLGIRQRAERASRHQKIEEDTRSPAASHTSITGSCAE
jgi:hypothetical protein